MSGKQRNLRKKRALEEDGDGEQPEVHKDSLEDLKLLQKQRKRLSGVDAAALARASEDAGAGGQEHRSELMEAYVKADSRNSLLDEEAHMKKYVERELAKRLGRSIDEGEQALSQAELEEQELYRMPEGLEARLQAVEHAAHAALLGAVPTQQLRTCPRGCAGLPRRAPAASHGARCRLATLAPPPPASPRPAGGVEKGGQHPWTADGHHRCACRGQCRFLAGSGQQAQAADGMSGADAASRRRRLCCCQPCHPGPAEVEVSTEEKLRKIEDTERIKRQLLASSSGNTDADAAGQGRSRRSALPFAFGRPKPKQPAGEGDKPAAKYKHRVHLSGKPPPSR
jgi:hypothetical protein